MLVSREQWKKLIKGLGGVHQTCIHLKCSESTLNRWRRDENDMRAATYVEVQKLLSIFEESK